MILDVDILCIRLSVCVLCSDCQIQVSVLLTSSVVLVSESMFCSSVCLVVEL